MCDIKSCTTAPTVRVGGTIKLCDTHANEDNFPRTRCGSCNKTVKIASTVFVAHTPFGAPSNMALCETCAALPRVACTKCQRILRVDTHNVAVSSNYADGATTYGGGGLPTHRIRVLFYMRPISFQQTLVHELTHALTNERGIGNKPLIEGFCNYVAYLFLANVSNTGTPADRAEALRAIARMEANDNVTYGVNFRTVRTTLANRPTQALTWLAST